MIINTNQTKDLEVIGDIQEFKTSIDPKNLEYITTLLSSNLYSNPEQSFIREIVSNAWDSHVEAGTTDTPVIIKLDPGEITIRDYGTGISPERFRNIYCNIGSSTKRDSNDYIGGFGLGRFSALSCSNTVFIDSFYNGVQYSYVMIKDGNSITTNLMFQQPTEEKNGVAISIKNLKDLTPYKRALKSILFFPNIYVDSSVPFYDSINPNKVQIKKFKDYACAKGACLTNKILLGNVLYPINESYFKRKAYDFLHDIRNTGIVIRFDIGDLDITPNRESIIYTEDTIKKIEKKILQVMNSFHKTINNCYKENYTNLNELLEDYTKSYFDYIESKLSDLSYDILFIKCPNTLKYKGLCLDRKQFDFLKNLNNITTCNIRGLLYKGHYYSSKFPYKCGKLLRLDSNIQRVIISNDVRLTADIRDYYESKYGSVLFISDNKIKPYLTVITKDKIPYKRLLLVDYLNLKRKDDVAFNPNDKDFLSFKASRKAVPKSTIRNTEILYLQSVNQWGGTTRVSYDNITKILNEFKRQHTGIILITKDDPYKSFLVNIIRNKKYKLYIAKKSIVKYVKELKPSYLIDRTYFTWKDPHLAIMNTYYQYKEKIHSLSEYIDMDIFGKTLDKDFKKEINKLFVEFRPYDFYDYKGFAKAYGGEDSYTKFLLEKYVKCLQDFKDATDITGNQYSATYNGYVIMKLKKYHIPFKLYQEIKSNKFLNLLCEKN